MITPDDNDRLRDGTLPSDPFEDAEEMTPPGSEPPVTLEEHAPVVGSFIDEAIARMEARARGEEKPIPVPWDTVATALRGGLWPGLHLLVGNTGSGKSQFALQVALLAARKNIPVLYVGLELGKIDLVARLLALLQSELNSGRGSRWSDLYLGENLGELEGVVKEHSSTLGSLPFHLSIAPPMGWKHNALEGLARAMRAKYPAEGHRPMLIVLDYLQLVAGDERELRERIGKAAYAGRAVARELDAAVLFVSSTSRENYNTLLGKPKSKGGKNGSSPTPMGQGWPGRLVGLGKESGEIEYSADTVLVLSQEPWKSDTPPVGGSKVWLAVAKQRIGPPSWAELRFNGSWFSKPAPEAVGEI